MFDCTCNINEQGSSIGKYAICGPFVDSPQVSRVRVCLLSRARTFLARDHVRARAGLLGSSGSWLLDFSPIFAPPHASSLLSYHPRSTHSPLPSKPCILSAKYRGICENKPRASTCHLFLLRLLSTVKETRSTLPFAAQGNETSGTVWPWNLGSCSMGWDGRERSINVPTEFLPRARRPDLST